MKAISILLPLLALALLCGCAPKARPPAISTPGADAAAARKAEPPAPAITPELFRKAGLQVPGNDVVSTDFALDALDGRRVSLSSFRGKVVLLSFWATWCAPCQIEMPAMQALYEKMKPKGFEVVAVDIQEDRATVAAFLKKRGYTFPVLLDTTGDIAASYGVNAIPTNFVIDRAGRILAKAVGIDGPEWSSDARAEMVEKLLSM